MYISKRNLFVRSFSEAVKIKNIGVVGSGQMGSGIAYVFGRYSIQIFNIFFIEFLNTKFSFMIIIRLNWNGVQNTPILLLIRR
jgi:hypothetical protein